MVVGHQDAAATDEGVWDFPTDIFAAILLRLQPYCRRRLRLVCRHWLDVIDTRARAVGCGAKPLLWNPGPCSASVIDGPEKPSRTLWSGGVQRHYGYEGPNMVGICNGLLCVCDNAAKPGGALTVINPATGEELPVPFASLFVGTHEWQAWHRAYCFTYRHATGQYKIVHVPCYFKNVCEFETLQVLTLGEAAWRDVPVPAGSRCGRIFKNCHGMGILGVNDAVYWVAEAGGKLMSFDLADESVSSVVALSVFAGPKLHLTEVHGRLDMATQGSGNVEVWVLEGEREARIWRRRYIIEIGGVSWSHFIYGEHVLTRKEWNHDLVAHRYSRLNNIAKVRSPNDVVRIGCENHATEISNSMSCQAFYYVETDEPLSAYKLP